MVVGVVHGAEERAAVLKGEMKDRWGLDINEGLSVSGLTYDPHEPLKFSYRFGEGHAGDRPVEHPGPDDVQRVEAHRVPDADVRSQKLNMLDIQT